MDMDDDYRPRVHRGRHNGCNMRDGFVPAGVPAPRPNVNVSGNSQFYSPNGTGQKNRILMSQYNAMIDSDGFDGDYNDFIKQISIEPEVADSHQTYTNDINRSTSGASSNVVRSDRNDINPRVGLRAIDYHSVYSASDARTDSSEAPDQMPAKASYCL
jgi:hypothetical protein